MINIKEGYAMSKKAYRRGWQHTKTRGRETTIPCGFCGRRVPRYKTFAVYRSFGLNDPLLRKELGGRNLSLSTTKIYACPACARHRKIVKKK